jgi:hypothetical protein
VVVRSSFVTNSSSSSFVALEIDSKEIAAILKEFEDQVQEAFEYGHCEINDDGSISLFMDEAYSETPSDPGDIVTVLASLFDWNFYDDYCYAQEDGEEPDMSQFSEITQRLVAAKDEIMANIKSFQITNGESGWQGDSDCRYNEDWYEPEALADIQSDIMEKHGYSCADDITDEDFCDYVGDKISIEENVFKYNGVTKEVTKYRITELEG